MKPAVELRIKGIKCDAPGCNYRDDSVEFSEAFLDKPCPQCGASLLTEEDLAFIKALEAQVDWFKTIIPQVEDGLEHEEVLRVHMDGTGIPASVEVRD